MWVVPVTAPLRFEAADASTRLDLVAQIVRVLGGNLPGHDLVAVHAAVVRACLAVVRWKYAVEAALDHLGPSPPCPSLILEAVEGRGGL